MRHIGNAIHALSLTAMLAVMACGVAFAEWSVPVKLGPNVNGSGANHFPFETADGQRLYLAAQHNLNPYGDNEDIFVCQWDSVTGKWGPRQLLGPEVNTPARELSPCESPDRQYLWFVRYAGGYDLYYSVWDTANAKWGTAVKAGPQLNSECVEWFVNISPDGKRMIVGHGKRPGYSGCEGTVMWISYWNDSTHWWDSLIWMGDTLNPAYGNVSASMSLDTTYIYFASFMHFPGVPKVGIESDFFRVKNTPFHWTQIENLGEPVCSYDRDETIAISADGLRLYLGTWRDTTKGSPDIYMSEWSMSVADQKTPRPVQFELDATYPNPFNAATIVRLEMGEARRVRVDVFDVLGRKVTTLHDGVLPAGEHEFVWDAGKYASGVYFVRATAGDARSVRKVMLLK